MDFLSFTFVLHVCFINQVDDGRDGMFLCPSVLEPMGVRGLWRRAARRRGPSEGEVVEGLAVVL